MSTLGLKEAKDLVEAVLDQHGPNYKIPLIKLVRDVWARASGEHVELESYRRALEESDARIRDLERDLQLAHEFALSLLKRSNANA